MQRLRLGFLLSSLLLLLTACPDPGTGVTPPSNVQTDAQAGKIVISWDAVTGADGYNVYRYQAGNESVVSNCNPVASSPCEDTGVEQGKSYRYSVTALKGSTESTKTTRTDPVEPDPVDNTLPNISLSANPTTINEGESSTLTATVSAQNGKNISKVEFLRGSTVLATDTSAPYTHSVSPTTTTTYTAKVTDSDGKTAQDTVQVTVDNGTTSCEAEAKSFTGVVNTPIKGDTRSAGEIAVIVSPLIGASCEDNAAKVSDPANGDVTVNADGTFKYIPDFKYVGPDSFQYKVGTSEPATVSLTIEEVSDAEAGNQYIYYVDNASSGPATGSLADPFTEIASVEAASKAGDIIYILAGDAEYQGTVDMKKNQKLMGQGTDFIVNGLTLAEAGTAPRITASGVGDNVYGIKLGKGELPNYAVVGALEIKGITIQNVGGGPTKDHPGSGIYSDNLQGTIIIEDVTIQNVTGHGMYIDHNNHDKPSQHEITIRNVDVINPGQHGIWIDDPTNLLIEGGSITGVEFLEAQPFSGVAIDPQDEFGNHGAGKSVTIRNVLIESSNPKVIGIRFIKNNKFRSNLSETPNPLEDTNVVIEGNTINLTGTETRGIRLDTYYGIETKVEEGSSNTLNYNGDQGDLMLSSSSANNVTASQKCQKLTFGFSGGTPAQQAEALARIKGSISGVTCTE